MASMLRNRNSDVRQRSVSTNTELTRSEKEGFTRPDKEGNAWISETYEIIDDKQSDSMPASSGDRSSNTVTDCEKEVYEIQLTQLQEQLEAAMIEKELLANKLKNYNSPSEMLRKAQEDLELEKKKNKELQEKLESGLRLEDINVEQKKRQPSLERKNSGKKERRNPSVFERAKERVIRKIYDVVDDFSEENRVEKAVEEKDTSFNIKILKENVKRFGNAAKPYVNTIKGLQSLLRWKSPAYTLIVFWVYMYAVYKGWTLQVLLLCFIFRHFISYLQSLGLKVQFNFLDPGEEVKEEEINLGFSDKINLVMQIAKQVQIALGKAADGLEKIQSVLTWRYTPAAKKLFMSLCAVFTLTTFFPPERMYYIIGLSIGIKLFIIDYLFYKYPRINEKYNSTHKLWKALPTEEECDKIHIRSHIDKYVLIDSAQTTGDSSEKGVDVEETTITETDLSDDDKTFCQLFSLPQAEFPLAGWHGGKRCTLINKQKSGIGAFKNGKLYLTKRKRSPTKENILIPLVDITKVSKSKPYGFLLGSGMAVEVVVHDRTFIFGGILGRDEAYDSIIEQGGNNMLSWATGLPPDENAQINQPIIRRMSNKKQNFSFPTEYVDND